MPPPPLMLRFLSQVCGVDVDDDDDGSGSHTLKRKLMVEEEGAEEDPDALFPRPPWLLPMFADADGDEAQGGRTDGYVAPPVGAEQPVDGAAPAAANPLTDLRDLMARVEQLEAAGDLDAAARLLSGAVSQGHK